MSERDKWFAQVKEKLAAATAEMEAVLGRPVRMQLDQDRLALDIVVPKWIVHSHLADFIADLQQTQASRANAGVVIKRTWEKYRDADPALWTFAGWFEQIVEATPDTRELNAGEFAERMRRRRNNG